MRSLSLSLSLALVVVAAAPAVAAGQEVVRLKVGETKPGVGTERPICDTPAVAVISSGVLKAIAPGETICSATSVLSPGVRRIFKVIVTPPDPTKNDGGASGTPR